MSVQKRIAQSWVEQQAGLSMADGEFINANPTLPSSQRVRELLIALQDDFNQAGLSMLRAALVQVRKDKRKI